jgi:hypothetical protein
MAVLVNNSWRANCKSNSLRREINKHDLFQRHRAASDLFRPKFQILPRFYVSENGRRGHLFAGVLVNSLAAMVWPTVFAKKKDCHLPRFSLILTPMAPCGARSEPVSFHLSQVKTNIQTNWRNR